MLARTARAIRQNLLPRSEAALVSREFRRMSHLPRPPFFSPRSKPAESRSKVAIDSRTGRVSLSSELLHVDGLGRVFR